MGKTGVSYSRSRRPAREANGPLHDEGEKILSLRAQRQYSSGDKQGKSVLVLPCL